MGDGPGANGEPALAPIAHTSQMMGDNYLFWRTSESGASAPFNSVMPSWKSSLDEMARWDLINYVRALGKGTVQPGQMMGGEMFDPTAAVEKQAEMVQRGVAQALFSAAEGEAFLRVHAQMDQLTTAGFAAGFSGGMKDMQAALLDVLIAENKISAVEAEIFTAVHQKLSFAGLME